MAQEGWKLEQEEATCTPPSSAPFLCSNNCGFFGSASTMNLCSSCYKNLVLLKPSPPPPIPPSPRHQNPQNEPDLRSSSSTSAPASPDLPPQEEFIEKAQPLRCLACQKKVVLRGFKCRCGDIFCSLHRYSDKHNCSFDYKAAGRVSIAKANPIVKADKLQRI